MTADSEYRLALQEIERLKDVIEGYKFTIDDVIAFNNELQSDIHALVKELRRHNKATVFDTALSEFTLKELTK